MALSGCDFPTASQGSASQQAERPQVDLTYLSCVGRVSSKNLYGTSESYDVAIMARLGVDPAVKAANVQKVADQREDEIVDSETFFMIFADPKVRHGEEDQTDQRFLSDSHQYGLDANAIEMHRTQRIGLSVPNLTDTYTLDKRTLKFEWDNGLRLVTLKLAGFPTPDRESYEVPCEKVSEDAYVSLLNDLRKKLVSQIEASRQNEIDAMQGSQI